MIRISIHIHQFTYIRVASISPEILNTYSTRISVTAMLHVPQSLIHTSLPGICLHPLWTYQPSTSQTSLSTIPEHTWNYLNSQPTPDRVGRRAQHLPTHYENPTLVPPAIPPCLLDLQCINRDLIPLHSRMRLLRSPHHHTIARLRPMDSRTRS